MRARSGRPWAAPAAARSGDEYSGAYALLPRWELDGLGLPVIAAFRSRSVVCIVTQLL
ncbi:MULTISPECIES: hypothetical protein [unclassified Streptomyces]|uniref:hypothetical protein n=1 Tax=unclassified Streptomyces TaxID=2593676 RepID=UPI0037F91BCD